MQNITKDMFDIADGYYEKSESALNEKDHTMFKKIGDKYMKHVETLQEALKRIDVNTDIKRGGTGKAVKCVQTGQVYDSQRQACIDLELSACALSNHLRGVTGHKTVKGYTFENVT